MQLQDGQSTSWGVIDCHNPNLNQDSPTLAFLKSQGVTHLDYICLSHPDLDHFSGIRQLLNWFCSSDRTLTNFFIPTLDLEIYQSVTTSKRKASALQDLYTLLLDLTDQGLVNIAQVGYGTVLAEEGACLLKSLGPYGRDLTSYVRDIRQRVQTGANPQALRPDKNLLSVVTVLEQKEIAVLLCSDAGKKSIEYSITKWRGERKKRGLGSRFHFVKVSHHGSEANNHEGLWKYFTLPKLSSAGISAGGRYGLPNAEAVRAITDAEVRLYCTTRSGCLHHFGSSIPQSVSYRGVSPVVTLGLDLISSPSQDFQSVPPLHGNISFVIENAGFEVQTQHAVAPIVSLP